MKLRDKLLILDVLAAFIIVGSAHLNNKSRYKKGMTVIDERQVKRSYPTPAHLSLIGFTDVTITHADNFSIQYERPDPNRVRIKEGGYKEKPERRNILPWYKGDTMVLSGYDSIYPSEVNHMLTRVPMQRIYITCPNISSISVEDGLLYLNGDSSAAHAFSAHLVLNKVQLAQLYASPV